MRTNDYSSSVPTYRPPEPTSPPSGSGQSSGVGSGVAEVGKSIGTGKPRNRFDPAPPPPKLSAKKELEKLVHEAY